MPKYRVEQTITLYGGELILNAAQASARAHNLEPVENKKGRYTIVSPVQFKAGEVIVIPGDPDKALGQRLTKLDKVAGERNAE